MKASELRIGNWVRHFTRSQYIQVIALNMIDKTGGPTINGWDEDEFSGTPITPEILVKAGFDDSDEREAPNHIRRLFIQVGNSAYLHYDIYQDTSIPELWGEWEVINEHAHVGARCWQQPRWLHELQNLFHSLAGEELDINLNEEEGQ